MGTLCGATACNITGTRKAVTQVAIDMSPAYIKGVRENFANATVSFDKFHVVSQVTKAVDEVRRKEARQDAVAKTHLEKTCWLWRKNPESWTEREERRWEQLKDKPLVTGWRMRCAWNCKKPMRREPWRWPEVAS